MNKKEIENLKVIVNRVRADASPEYQNHVKQLGDSLAEFSESFFAYEPATNEFAKGIVNLFAKIIWTEGTYSHNLDFLKKGTYSTGIDIEEIHVNPSLPSEYSRDDVTGLLGHYDPETMTMFYRENRHDIFPQTINEEILSKAFKSWDNLAEFITRLKSAVETGNALREFNLLKKAIVDGYKVKDMFVTQEVDFSNNDAIADTMALIRKTINDFTFVSSKYNKYAIASGTGKVAQLVSKKDDIFIMTTTKHEAQVRKYLAGVFNIQELEDANRFILVDDFGYDKYVKTDDSRQLVIEGHETSDIAMIIADRHLVQWWERLKIKTTFENGYTLDTNTFTHIWQTLGLSYLANAVVFVDKNARGNAIAVDTETAFFNDINDSIELAFTDANGETVNATADNVIIGGVYNTSDGNVAKYGNELSNFFNIQYTEGGTVNIAFNKENEVGLRDLNGGYLTISLDDAECIISWKL